MPSLSRTHFPLDSVQMQSECSSCKGGSEPRESLVVMPQARGQSTDASMWQRKVCSRSLSVVRPHFFNDPLIEQLLQLYAMSPCNKTIVLMIKSMIDRGIHVRLQMCHHHTLQRRRHVVRANRSLDWRLIIVMISRPRETIVFFCFSLGQNHGTSLRHHIASGTHHARHMFAAFLLCVGKCLIVNVCREKRSLTMQSHIIDK